MCGSNASASIILECSVNWTIWKAKGNKVTGMRLAVKARTIKLTRNRPHSRPPNPMDDSDTGATPSFQHIYMWTMRGSVRSEDRLAWADEG